MIRSRLRLAARRRAPAADAPDAPPGAQRETATRTSRRRRRVRRVAGVLAAALALTLVAGACGDDEKAPIKLGYSAWPGWFPWKIAEEKGMFAQHGVDVELQWFDGYLDSLTALSSNTIDANSQTLNDTLISVSGGAKQVIVLTNDNSTGNDQIIAAEGITDLAGLAGKKIAVEKGTVDHFLLLLALDKVGLSSDDFELVNLPTSAAAAAFKSGEVDAVGAFAPFTTTALERPGSAAIADSSDFPGAIPDHLVVSADLLASRPQDVQALVDTWFDVLAFIKANPDEAVNIMAARADVSVADYKSYDAGTTIFSLEDNVEAFTPGNTDANLDFQAKKISDFLVSTELVDKPPSLEGLFDPSFIENVKK